MSQAVADPTRLAVAPIADASPRDPASKPADPYVELKRVIAGRGLLERSPRRQLLPAAGHLLLLAVVIVGITFTAAPGGCCC